MNCSSCRELLSPYYDGELKGEEEDQFIEHLRTCPRCKREFATFSRALGALKSLTGELDVPGIAEAVGRGVAVETSSQAARWHQLVAGDMRDVSEMLRPARGGLLYLATAAAAVLFAIVLGLSLMSAPQPEQPEPLTEVAPPPVKQGPVQVFVPEVTQEGMVRIDGRWVTKEEAFAAMLKERGYIRYEDWLVPEEDAASLKMKMVRRGDRWLTPDEFARRLKRSDVVVTPPPVRREPVPVPKEVVVEKPAGILEEELRTRSPEPTERPVAANEVAAFLTKVSPDQTQSHGGLTLFSLVCDKEDWVGKDNFYTTLAFAVERGLARLKETGEVSKVLIKKQPGFTLFSIGGGVFFNGWQCRLSGPDVVLSVDTTEALIDVYCAEKGRWEGSKDFSVANYLAVSDVRKRSYSAEEQEDIWQSIKAVRKTLGVHSFNRSIQKLYEKSSVKRQIARFKREFARMKGTLRLNPRSIGIAVLVDGQVVGADLFINNNLLVESYDQLIRTYAVEAAIAHQRSQKLPPDERMRAIVSDFVAAAARSTYRSAGSPGYVEYKITDTQSSLFGYALTAENVPVHVSLFADDTGLKERHVVPRVPEIVKGAEGKPTEEPSAPRERKFTPEEEAAAKLLREGKIKPRVPMPPATPSPPAPPSPRRGR